MFNISSYPFTKFSEGIDVVCFYTPMTEIVLSNIISVILIPTYSDTELQGRIYMAD